MNTQTVRGNEPRDNGVVTATAFTLNRSFPDSPRR